MFYGNKKINPLLYLLILLAVPAFVMTFLAILTIAHYNFYLLLDLPVLIISIAICFLMIFKLPYRKSFKICIALAYIPLALVLTLFSTLFISCAFFDNCL